LSGVRGAVESKEHLMASPDDFFKAVFGWFESLLVKVVVVAILLAGLGYWIAHC
jgi:hypothetical protein